MPSATCEICDTAVPVTTRLCRPCSIEVREIALVLLADPASTLEFPAAMWELAIVCQKGWREACRRTED